MQRTKRQGNDMEGMKFDDGKLRWDLLPITEIEEVVKVLTLGAAKYDDDNWKKVADGNNRYYAAALRHITAHRKGEIQDIETGCSHLSHAICCLIFLLWKTNNDN